MNLWADRCLNVDSTGETVALAVSSHPSCSADPSSHQINSSTFVQSHPSTLPPFTLVPTSCCGQKKKKKKHPVCYSHETSYLPGMRAHLPPVSPPHPSGSTGPTTTSGPSQLAASASRPTPTAGKQIHVLSTLKNKKRASNIPWKQKYLNYTRIIWKHFDSTSMLHPWSWRDI